MGVRESFGAINWEEALSWATRDSRDGNSSKRGWGHSTWQEGVRLCREASAERLAIFHHDPDHPDEVLERIEEQSTRTWEGAFVAREGMRIVLA